MTPLVLPIEALSELDPIDASAPEAYFEDDWLAAHFLIFFFLSLRLLVDVLLGLNSIVGCPSLLLPWLLVILV